MTAFLWVEGLPLRSSAVRGSVTQSPRELPWRSLARAGGSCSEFLPVGFPLPRGDTQHTPQVLWTKT